MRAFTTCVVMSCCVLAVASTSAFGAAHLYTVPATVDANPGDTIFFEVWTDDSNAEPVKAWQIWFDCLGVGPDGGGAGTVEYTLRPKPCVEWYHCCPTPGCDVCTDGFCETTLAGPLSDDERADYIFSGISHTIPTENLGACDADPYDPFIDGPRAAGAATSNPFLYPVVTPDDPKYLCSWAFHVSEDACEASFTVDWYCDANDGCSGDRTALLKELGPGQNASITPLTGDPLVVNVAAECEPVVDCPAGAITFVDPPDGVVDARQPHPVGSPTPAQGIDTFIVEGATGAADSCWEACEVGGTPPGIASVTEDAGTYTITLDRPITPGAVTTLTYTDDDAVATTGTFIAHPGNANGDTAAAPPDILALIDYLNGVGTLPWDLYSCDINQTLECNPQDILTLIDLLNGAGEFNPWNGTALPVNDGSCP